MIKYKGLHTTSMIYISTCEHAATKVELIKNRERYVVELSPAWRGFFLLEIQT